MPRVPSYQPNQVGPVQITDARIRAADNDGGAFGAVGRGLQGLGVAAGDFAEAEDRRQAQFDDTQTRKEASAVQSQLTQLTTGYSALQGGNAVEGRAGIEKQIDDLTSQSLGRAANPRQKRMLEERLAEINTASKALVGRHAAGESIVERRATFKGQSAAFADSAASTDDVAGSEDYKQQGLAAVRSSLDFEGIRDPLARATAEKEYTSGIHSAKIGRWFRDVDPDVDMIASYTEAHRDEMTLHDYAGVLQDLQRPLQNREDDAAFARAMAGGEPGADGTPAAAPVGGRAAFKAATQRSESSGDPNARNTRSSASGLYQFTDSTFLRTYKAEFPNSGMSDAAILRRKNEPDLQERLMDRLTNDNAAALRAAGHSESPGNLYLAHFAGAAGANKVLDAPAGASVDDVLGAKVVAANPFLAGWTVSRLRSWAAEKGGGSAALSDQPQQWNKTDAYARIDALAGKEGWSPEKVERVKARADRRISRDEELINRQFRTAGDEATRVVAGLGDAFTSVSQIPRSVRDQMDPTDLARLQSSVEQKNTTRAKAAQEAAWSDRNFELELMRRFQPEQFKRIDPRAELGRISPTNMQSLLTNILDANKPVPFDVTAIRGGINSEIGFQEKHGAVKLGDADKMKLYDFMESQLQLIQRGKGKLDAGDYRAAYQTAVRTVAEPGRFWGTNEVPMYDSALSNVPEAKAEQIRRNWRGPLPPTNGEIIAAYRDLLGQH